MAVDNTHFKGSWRPDEDEALRKSVAIYGEKNWSVVARHFNTLMGRQPNLGRAPKQCRSRYLQQLVPGIKTGEWSVEEEETLVEGHRQFGNQWTTISSMLPGRTETSVKNHYNCTARRKVPHDLGKMTVLQRYLASIGVISVGGSKSAPARPGSGFPSSGQFFAPRSMPTRHRSGGGGRATRSAPLSPAASEQYDDDDDQPMAQQYQQQAASYAGEYGGYGDAEAAAYEAAAMLQAQQALQLQLAGGYGEADNYGNGDAVEEDAAMAAEGDAHGAAAGLLQLARAALLHLDEEEEDTDEGGPGTGGPAACGDEDDQGMRQQAQAPHQRAQQRKPSSGGWLQAELAGHSGSEASEHTAEEEEDGSPLSQGQLKRHMKPGSSGGKRSSPGSRPGQREAASHPSSKRCRSMWGAEQHLPGPEGATGTSGGSPFGLQLPLAGSSSASGAKLRPVLDVSEVAAGRPGEHLLPATATAGSVAAPPEPHSPAATARSDTCGPPAPADPGAQALLAFMMRAFMGAAQGPEPGGAASTLSPSHLAAIARAMAMSALSGQALGRGSSRGSQAGCEAAAGSGAACLVPHSPTGSPAAAAGPISGGLPSPGSAVSSDMSQVLSALTREGSGVQQPAPSSAAASGPCWPSLIEQQLKAAAAASSGR